MGDNQNQDQGNFSIDKDQIQQRIKKGRVEGRKKGSSELQGNLNYFQSHAINEDHYVQMCHDYFFQCQNDFSNLRSYYKSAVLSFRQFKKKIVLNKWLHDMEVKPISQEELDYITEMYLAFSKTKPDFGMGINIETEIDNLEDVVFEYEKIQIRKLQLDWIIRETNKRIASKNKSGDVEIGDDKKIFNTVWEAVLYHSVLVDLDQKQFFKTKKDIPNLVKDMVKPDGTVISHNTFYQKLQKIQDARKGIADPKHGKYTLQDYQAVQDRLLDTYPDAISLLKEIYFHNELY